MPVTPKSLGCELPLPDPQLQRGKGTFNDAELDDVSRRMELLASRLKNARNAVQQGLEATRDQALKLVLTRYENAARLSQVNKLNPGLGTRSIQHQLARDFAVAYDMFGLGNRYTPSGEVRQFFNRARRLWEGGVHEALAKIEFIQINEKAWKQVLPLKRKYGLSDSEFRTITSLAEEIGWQKYINEYGDLASNGTTLLKKRQDNFLERLRRLGFDDDDVAMLLDNAHKVADVYQEAIAIGARAGINIEQLKEIGYFPKIFSAEALRRFDWEMIDDGVKFSDGITKNLRDVFTSAKNSFKFLAEDEVLLDYLFRSKNPEIYKVLSDETGQVIENIRDVLDDSKVLGRALFEHLDEETVDRLVRSNILSKTPMTSEEIFNHLKTLYPRLPFKLDELISTDWGRTAQLFEEQLSSMAGKSGMEWMMVRNAIENGWGVSAAERAANPKLYRSFVPLSDSIPAKLHKQFGLSDLEAFKSTYVHPIVSDLNNALLDISTSPTKMSVFGQVLGDLMTTFRTMVTATTGFVTRQLWSQFVQVGAAGGNILDYLPTLVKTITAHKVGYNVFDDTRKIYRGFGGELVTERALYHQAVEQGLVNAYTAFNGQTVGNAFHSWNPLNVKRGARYLWNTVNEYKSWGRAIQEVSEMAKYAINDVAGQPFRFFNNAFDNAAKFSVLKSLTATDAFNRPGLFVEKARAAIHDATRLVTTGQTRHMNLEEAVEHIGQYFYWYDDLGRVDKFIGRYVVPFWTYRSRNLPMQVRHVLRNPHAFATFNKLYAAQNAPMYLEGEDFPEGGLPNHVLNDKNWYWKMPNGDYFALPMTPIDPMADAWNGLEIGANEVLRSFGIWTEATQPRTPDDQIKKNIPWDTSPSDGYLDGILKDTYPIHQAIASTIKGEDIRTGRSLKEDDTGRQYSSFLGTYIHPLGRYWLETLVPILGTVNRANPGGIFGLRPEYDTKTGALKRPGKRSIFGAERSDRDRVDDEVSKTGWIKMLRDYGGLNPQYLDIAYNMGYREETIRAALLDGKKTIQKASQNLPTIADPKRRAEQEQRIGAMKAAWAALELDYRRFYKWRTERGLKPRAAIRELQRQNMIIHNLPATPDEQKVIDDANRLNHK
jgi:hypothetical protein